MPKIVLKERDMTTVAYANDTNDVVFVPGIADTNWNVWITDVPNLDPNSAGHSGLAGTAYVEGDTIHRKKSTTGGIVVTNHPSLVVNTFDKKMWKYADETDDSTVNPVWVLMDTYTEPSPMNTPTYLASTVEFASKFGGKPYKWVKADFGHNASSQTTGFNTARKLPQFNSYELPGNATDDHYFYNEGDEEISWIYANDLIYAGMPVVFEDVARTQVDQDDSGFYRKLEPNLTQFYARLDEQLTGKPDEVGYNGTHGVYTNYELGDMSTYNFKYVTSGGYPVFNQGTYADVDAYDSTSSYAVGDEVNYNGKVYKCKTATADPAGAFDSTKWTEEGDYFSKGNIINNMLNLCVNRGDCYALIDHADNVIRPWYGDQSLIKAVNDYGFGESAKYAGMFTPWATYSIDMLNEVKLMPASFGYLRTLARGMVAYNNYYAYAGVNRGVVYGIKELHCAKPLTNTVANDLQTKDGYSINPITFIRPYGLTIWGNRTLLEAEGDLKATNFLNIRNLVCEVQKTAYQSAKLCLFENDTLGTWVKFTNPIKELLNNMLNGGGLAAFDIVRIPVVEKAVISVEIRLVPIYAVEEFWITVSLLDNGEVTVVTE